MLVFSLGFRPEHLLLSLHSPHLFPQSLEITFYCPRLFNSILLQTFTSFLQNKQPSHSPKLEQILLLKTRSSGRLSHEGQGQREVQVLQGNQHINLRQKKTEIWPRYLG